MELVTASVFHPGASPDAVYLDQLVVEPKLGLLAVADAPNGGDDGKAGVRIALEAVKRHVERNEDILARFRAHPAPELRTRVLTVIDEAFGRAAQEVFAFARRRKGLVVTLDMVLLLDHEAFIGHVGDGRVYLIRRGLVHQLTVDHSHADEGEVFDVIGDDKTEESADAPVAQAGGRSVTRSLGPLPGVRVESMCMELAQDDRFVACTAHLHRNVPESSLQTLFVGELLSELGAAVARYADKKPALAAAAQLGSGEPFKADSARSRLALLAPMPLFAHCTERELRSVAQAAVPRKFEAGATLFTEGETGEELFLLVSGQVAVRRQGKTLATLGPGSNFGEMAMLDDKTRSATIVAVEASEAMTVHRDAFFAMLRGNPMLAMKILWNMLLRLSANLRTANAKLAELQKGA
jgi:PPM family protein phosphatase